VSEPAADPIGELQARMEAVERRLDGESKRLDAFMTEMRATLDRQTQESRDQRIAILESNDALRREVIGFRTTMDVVLSEHRRSLDANQNAANAFNRNAEGMAARMGTVERVLEELREVKREQVAVTKELKRRAKKDRRRTPERRKQTEG